MCAQKTNSDEVFALYVNTLKEKGMPFVHFGGNTRDIIISCPECGHQFTVIIKTLEVQWGPDMKVHTLGIGFNCPACTTYFKVVPKKRKIQ